MAVKITRAMVGRYVELAWRDPCRVTLHGPSEFELYRGRRVLPCWVERGVIDDLTDDVVRLIHSATGRGEDEVGETRLEKIATFVPAELIERVTLYDVVPSEAKA